MAVKKQPDNDSGTLSEGANDWFRLFLKYLEIHMAETGQGIPSEANAEDYSLAAIQAVKLTLLDSGLDNEQVLGLFGRVSLEQADASKMPSWTDELNQRRFVLIDSDIQGTLSRSERLELAGLTQLMREHMDSEYHLPFKGAKELHRHLAKLDSDSKGSSH